MIYTLLTIALIAILMAGMILAARMQPQEENKGQKNLAARRLEFIRRSSLLH